MSGHGGFSVIGGGASSQDYDLEEITTHQLELMTQDLPDADRYRCTPHLCEQFKAVLKAYMAAPQKTADLMKLAYGKIGGIETQTKHLAEMRRIVDERDASQFLTNKTLEAAFEGRIAVTTLVETRLNGLPDEDADPALDGANAVSADDWGKRDVQRKVAGPPPAPLPPYNGTSKGLAEFDAKVQKTVRRTVCLFRRDILEAIAKPGWFEV